MTDRGARAHLAAQSPPGAHSAFTLIELMVVVSILALLLAILLPSLGRARAASRGVACLSNLRQLGIAAHMYADVHRGAIVDSGLPHGGLPSVPGKESESWFHTMSREYKNKLVARCPSDSSPYWDQDLPGTSPPARRRVSFAINDYLTGDLNGWLDYNRRERIKRPTGTILLVELAEEGSWAASDHIHAELWLFNPRAEAERQVALDRHLGKANYVFLDGHAEPLLFERTYALRGLRREGGRFVPEWQHNLYDPKVAR